MRSVLEGGIQIASIASHVLWHTFEGAGGGECTCKELQVPVLSGWERIQGYVQSPDLALESHVAELCPTACKGPR